MQNNNDTFRDETGRKYSNNKATKGKDWLGEEASGKAIDNSRHVDPRTGRRYSNDGAMGIEEWKESDDDEEKDTDHWWYKDEEGDIIGPNPGGHVLFWLKEGHVSNQTMVSSDNTTWKTISEVRGLIEDSRAADDKEGKKKNKLAESGKE